MNNLYLNGETNTPNDIMNKTYGLLALSLLPTILGTVIGMQMQIIQNIYAVTGGLGFFILNLVLMIALIFGISKSGDTPLGISLLMLFTFISGILLSVSVERTLRIPNGAELVGIAFAGTVAIFGGMSILNKILGRDLSFMGKGLFIALIALLVGSLLFVFFPSKIFYVVLTVACLILFTVYLLYDLNQIMMGGETSYVNATLSLYIDLMNIFRSLLSLLGLFSSDD